MSDARHFYGLLQALRQQALAAGPENAFSGERRIGAGAGSHQLNAHWSIAYAIGQPPEPWELYRAASLHLMPRTDFYNHHAQEIQEALLPTATWELLERHAVPKLKLEAAMSDDECKLFGHPCKVQYYDAVHRGWCTVDIPSVRWFDGREYLRDALVKGEDTLRNDVSPKLQRAKAWQRNPSARRLQDLEGAVADVARTIAPVQKWLAHLDATPDFGKAVFALLRQAENAVRESMGVARVGEAWVSETELLYRVRKLLPGVEVIHHGREPWIARGQHLDVWIPTLKIAIEYQGEQHFRPIAHFGGAAGYERRQVLDARKRAACERQGVRLMEIAYDRRIDDVELLALLERNA